MKCDKYSETLLDYAGGEHSDEEFGRHLESCDICRREVVIMETAFTKLETSAPFKSPANPDAIFEGGMKAREKSHERSSLPWLLSGAVTIIGIALISPLTTELSILNSWAGFFQQVMYIVLGLLLCAFIAMYSYTHQSMARRIAENIQAKIHPR